ncbi:MAG: hypothetical protein M3081_18880, partial [Gemmatimonadota bacterium]|nr:hypothetical protein [Gemmatimonadota bacterium]
LTPARVTLPTVEVTAIPVVADYRLSAADVAARHDESSDIGAFLDRWKPRMLGDEWKQCKVMKPTSSHSGSKRYLRSLQFHDADSLRIYINGVHAAPWDLDEIRARDVLEARYFDCHEKDPLLRNALVIVLKPGAAP